MARAAARERHAADAVEEAAPSEAVVPVKVRAARPRALPAERVAILTDVHGNLPALEAVLAEVDRLGIAAIYCCGDIVGYGPWPNETGELLRARGIPSLLGNVDADALSFPQDRRRLKKHRHPDKYRSLQFTAGVLSEASRRFLEELPARLEVEIAGRKILLVHGSPEGNRDSVRPDVTSEVLAAWLDQAQAAAIVCGHTHLPFVRSVDGRLFVNAGTAGRPSDGDPRVSFAVLTVGPKLSAEILSARSPLDRQAPASPSASSTVPLRVAKL